MQVLYAAENYNHQQSVDCHLTLAIGEKGVGFAVHAGDTKLQLLVYFAFYVPLKENESVFFDFVRSQEYLKHKYKTTTVVLQGNKNTLVPAELYNDLYVESYLRHLYETEKNEIVKSTPLFNNTVQMVYAVKEYMFYPARTKYYGVQMEPPAAHYIRKSASMHAGSLNVYVQGTDMYLIHCQNNAPVFYNCYSCPTDEERAYFIANYYQTFGAQGLPLQLHGNPTAQLMQMLGSYAPKQVAAAVVSGLEIPEGFEFDFLIDFCH